MDPLSDVLSLLKPRSYAFRGLDAGGEWSVDFPAGEGVKCYAVLSGQCWIRVDQTAPVRLSAGDCILLPRGQAFRFSSGTDAPPVDGVALFSVVREGDFAVINGGGDCSGIGGYFAFGGAHADLLLSMLPPIVHFRTETDKAALRWSVERLMKELREPEPGGSLLAEHLAQTLLIQALRLHLAERSGDGAGWLFALADKQMSAAIAAMHADPGRRWTLRALADVAGMSRSSFAARFKATVNETAMEYLTRWRMLIAADRLTTAGTPISTIAPSLGYESESAFGAAFKRVIGSSPRRFARTPAKANPASAIGG